MDVASAYEQVVAWLKGLPVDCELAWGDDATTAASGLAYGFVDAYVPLAATAFDLQWLWTIFPTPSDRERERTAVVAYLGEPAEHELLLEPEVLAACGLGAAGPLTVAELAAALGEEVEIRIEVETAAGWEEVRRRGEPFEIELAYDATLEIAYDAEGEAAWARLYPDAGGLESIEPELLDLTALAREQAIDLRWEDDRLVRARRVWTLVTLDAALQGWALAHAERADLRFVCREVAPSPLAARLARRQGEAG